MPEASGLRSRDIAVVVGVVTVWGLNFIAMHWGVAEISPLLMSGLRYVAAVLPAIFFVRRPKVALGLLVAYGLFVGVGQFGLLFSAIKLGMPAGLASIVVQVQAFVSILLAVLFLRERISVSQALGAAVAFVGVGVIAYDRIEGAVILPLLMSILAACCWGVANLITKWAGKIDMLGFVVWSSLVPPLPLLALSILIEGPGAIPAAFANITWVGVGSILFVGWLGTVFGYGAWSVMLSRHPASTIAPFTLLVPVVGIGASALILGERINGLEIAGSVLVFAGLLLNTFGPRRRPDSGAAA
jgi:O-acetylserine/cysteine efflux transporter